MQVALAWVLKNPAVTSPIIGTSKPHHLDDALAGMALKLTDDEIKTLEAPYQPKPVLDHL
jgi:aryl-alcohol dehydrogenase (NADP+)